MGKLSLRIVLLLCLACVTIALVMRSGSILDRVHAKLWFSQNRDFILRTYTVTGMSTGAGEHDYLRLWRVLPVQHPRRPLREGELERIMGHPSMRIDRDNRLCTMRAAGRTYLKRLYSPFPSVQPPLEDHVLVYLGPKSVNALFWIDANGQVYAFHVGPS